MIMADVFQILFIVLGLWIGIQSHWLLYGALFPKFTARSCRQFGVQPGRCLFWGGLTGIPSMLILLTIASNGGPFQVLGITLLACLLMIALMGATGIAQLVGLRLTREQSTPWGTYMRGGSVLAGAYFLPILGWFIVLPLSLIAGLGVVILQKRIRVQRHSETQEAVAQPAKVQHA